uniref:Uncharacterized protein n=1 Tax=Physcomitrium patens TaxID=3218 RepID=A0A2K1IN54_PHYPA|nr:hypothetical protein PHYPA_027028 [Physcomitrium patens]
MFQPACRCSIVVSIPACHAGDPGSIPGSGGLRNCFGHLGTLHSDFVQTSIIVSLAFPSLPCILVSFHHPLLSPNSLPTNPHETNPNPFIEDTLLCLYSLGSYNILEFNVIFGF